MKTEEEWRDELTPGEYEALRRRGTEPPFSGKYVHTKDKGMYHYACPWRNTGRIEVGIVSPQTSVLLKPSQL